MFFFYDFVDSRLQKEYFFAFLAVFICVCGINLVILRRFLCERMRIRSYILYILLFFSMMAWGQEEVLSVAERNAQAGFNDTIDRQAEDFVTVSLLVCDPYEVLYSSLGHAALRLQCPAYDLDYVFSYEGESVRAKMWTYLRGDLKMGMYAFPTDLFLALYEYAGRGVTEYEMNLSPEQEQQLWRKMDEMRTAGMTLPYDFFKRGCAKSVVMVVKQVVGPNGIHYAPWSPKYTDHTIRELVRDYITTAPWTEFMLYFLIGTEAEQPMNCEQKLIVPTDLVEVWQQATLDNGRPVLAGEGKELVHGTWQAQPSFFTPLLASLILLLLAIGALLTVNLRQLAWRITGAVIDGVVMTVVTVLGAVMTYLVCFSSLPCTDWNWLIIPFNIAPALAWFLRRYWAVPYAIVLAVWCAVMTGMMLWGHVLVDWPHILLALAFAVTLVRQKWIEKKQ